jgi:hypothetical protein
MSFRTGPQTVPEQIADLYEKLRQLQSGQTVIAQTAGEAMSTPGVPGPAGATGPTGSAGAAGATGPTGPEGPQWPRVMMMMGG